MVTSSDSYGDPHGDADLWAWVRTLPDKQRLAVGYRYGADMAYDDIAVRLDCHAPRRTPPRLRKAAHPAPQLEPEEART